MALLVALASAGWAATRLPPSSVGTRQLRDASVTNGKLAARAVGNGKLKADSVGRADLRRATIGGAQVDAKQVQARLRGTCPGRVALGSVSQSGTVACNATLPQAYDRGSSTIRLTAAQQLVASKPLANATPFLVIAYPQVTVKGSMPGQNVEVGCTLGVGQRNGAVRGGSLRFEIGPHLRTQAATIPLVLSAPGVSGGGAAGVRCSDSFAPATAPPKVSVKTTIDAIQT